MAEGRSKLHGRARSLRSNRRVQDHVCLQKAPSGNVYTKIVMMIADLDFMKSESVSRSCINIDETLPPRD